MAPRAGFEPARGLPHRLSRPASHGQEPLKREWKIPKQESSSEAEILGTLPLPGWQELESWLRVSSRTIRDYKRYYERLTIAYPGGVPYREIPELAKNKWQRNLIRKIAEYQWARGRISWEDKLRVEALAKPPAGSQSRRVKSIVYTVEDLKRILELVQDPRYRLLYIIMYYSGARITEAIRLLETAKTLGPVTPEQAKNGAKGYIPLGKAVRVALHYTRGRKRCDYLWLPAWLFELAQRYRGEPPTDQGIRSYYRDLKARLEAEARERGEKPPRLVPPGDVRALFYQLLEDLEVDLEIRYVLSNRYSKLTVSELHYSKILRRADEAYEQRILPFLEEVSKMLG